jgi:hypothetical protein
MLPATDSKFEVMIESQRFAINSLHRQVERLKLERARLLIELGRAWDAILDAKIDYDHIAYESFDCDCVH